MGTFTNWSPLVGPPEAADNVFVGDIPIGQNSTSLLDADYEILDLTISNGSDVDTEGFFLDINGDLSISNSGSSFLADQHASGSGTTAVDVENININAGGLYRTEGARTIVTVPGTNPGDHGAVNVAAGGVLSGWGTLRYQDGLSGTDTTQLFNDGTLRAARDGTAPDADRFTLLIESSDGGGNAFVDLDGTSNGGTVNIDSNTTLDIDVGVRDFWGTMNFDPGSVLELSQDQLFRGTTVVNVDAASTTAGVPSTATIAGGNFLTAIGAAQFNVVSGTLVFDTTLNFAAAPDINLSNDTGLEFNSGGSIEGDLNMDAEDLTLTVNSSVAINDDEWNWDGLSGHASTTIVNQGGVLTINSDSIETSLDGEMNGDIEINGGTLDANVTGGWTFGGSLEVDSNLGQSVIRGTTMTVADATLTVGAGAATTQIDTSVTFTPDATTIVAGTLVLGNSGVGHNICFRAAATTVAMARWASAAILPCWDSPSSTWPAVPWISTAVTPTSRKPWT